MVGLRQMVGSSCCWLVLKTVRISDQLGNHLSISFSLSLFRNVISREKNPRGELVCVQLGGTITCCVRCPSISKTAYSTVRRNTYLLRWNKN